MLFSGIKLTLFHTPGETRDQISVWIPGEKVVIPADNIAKSFPNLSAIRGAPPRDPEAWYHSLDKVRRLRAKYMVPCHLLPVFGEKKIYDIITAFRDAIQFVNDQTIRYLNDGHEVDEIVEKVKLPPALASHPYLQELYGTVEWSVRGIIERYLGWFDRHPVNLYPLTKQERAQRTTTLLNKEFEGKPNGLEKMLIVAEEGLQNVNAQRNSLKKAFRCDLQWSLELLSHILNVAEPDSQIRKQAEKKAIICLKQLADLTTCPSAKRYYLACAVEFPTNFTKKAILKGRAAKIQQWPIDYTMNRMKYSLRSEACETDEEMTIIFVFPDVSQVHSYSLRHCILEHLILSENIPEDYDAKITTSSSTMKDLLTQKQNALFAKGNGNLTVEGKFERFERFIELLDMCPEMHSGDKQTPKSVL